MQTKTSADVLVHAPAGQLVAVAELWNRPDLSPEEAARVHAFVIDEGYSAQASFVLVLSQDRGYLWRGASAQQPDAPPDVAFDMRPIVARYLPDLEPQDRLRHSELSLIAQGWLGALAIGERGPDDEPERALADTGLIATLRRGRVTAAPR
jgi:hypothetical protein